MLRQTLIKTTSTIKLNQLKAFKVIIFKDLMTTCGVSRLYGSPHLICHLALNPPDGNLVVYGALSYKNYSQALYGI